MAHSWEQECNSKPIFAIAAYYDCHAYPNVDESVIASKPPYSELVDPSFLHTFNIYMVTDNEECCAKTEMVALRFLLALLSLAAAMPSSDALQHNALVRRHCMAPKNCGAVVQSTACDYCCAKDVKPDSSDCKSKDNKACQTSDKKDGIQFSCDAD
ncbi:hypothetical protein LY76DRAFT_644969 [Colletotrichum caudatum]|nr:hypothetical protein LY76DRAFT_644969 [Colletotrichum caudatum]